MKLKTDALLEQLISDGINAALSTCDQLDGYDRVALGEQLSTEIWLQLDTYFDFE
jgi:hypothetical protein